MNRLLYLGLILAAGLSAAPAYVFGPSQTLHFVLQDHLQHPLYWWPRTLLSYPVGFQGVELNPGQLALHDEAGTAIPFQLSSVKLDGNHLAFATISFFSDLPSAGHHDFVLTRGVPAAMPKPVTEEQQGAVIILNSGVMRLKLAASQTITAETPGPIQQLSRASGAKWMGGAKLMTPGMKAMRIHTERLESGPLFITYRVSYQFQGGASYEATIRCIAGMDYAEFHEHMDGFASNAHAYLDMPWLNFHPTHRQSPNNPYVPGSSDRPQAHYEDYPWEHIDDQQLNTHIGVVSGLSKEGEIGFRLGLFQPWPAFLVGSFANFWDTRTNDAVGLFIDKPQNWNDHDYAIWHASTRLEVGYFYRDGTLSWRWPLANGTRSTCIALYDHAKDIEAMHEVELAHAGKKGVDGYTYKSSLYPSSYMLFMQNRHGTFDLNDVKDWTLTYPDTNRRPAILFRQGHIKNAADLERAVLTSGLVNEAIASGTRQNGGFGPTSSRQVDDSWVDAYNRFYPVMTPRERERITAAFLTMAYVHAGEDYMPMKPMLSGHPNFLSDVKSVPAQMSFLFPEHPEAANWANEFQKYVQLNTHYHTRPAVTAWDAKGGRWTESLTTYVWGFFRPALRAAYLLRQFDGGNRFVSPELAELGNWLVDSLSAPFDGDSATDPSAQAMHQWGFVAKGDWPRRIFPPIGAHSARRAPPRSLWLFGTLLQRYAPLTAEHLMWAARPTDQDVEVSRTAPDPWSVMYGGPDNLGTNPHLASAKYTGYGLVLRAGVDTRSEVSLHVQQIDDGPNYRWGVAGEGGNGILYYYAGGKAYSHNGTEDFGDRAEQETDFCSTFGVFKDGKFRSIGFNVVDRPFYDFEAAQYAELDAKKGSGAYSWPEYLSRSVLLAGADYFVTYDATFNPAIPHRFSWFNKRGDDFPFLQVVKGGGQRTELNTEATSGVWLDGLGDSMVVVSHRKDVVVNARPYGAQVQTNGSTDQVFEDPKGVHFDQEGVQFDGSAGIVRHHADGRFELALFHGSQIAAGGVSFQLSGPDAGISAVFSDPKELHGYFYAPQTAALQIFPADTSFYVDGAKLDVQRVDGGLKIQLPPGRHEWQVTSGKPVPPAPAIDHTENTANGARIFLTPVAGAASYQVELSRDSGATWTPAGATQTNIYDLKGLSSGVKVHVRAIAVNETQHSKPGPEYPIYIIAQPPLPPDGLALTRQAAAVHLTWGELLGVKEYRLYRRASGTQSYALVYHGVAREYTDRQNTAGGIFEYSVCGVSGNGEGPRSRPANTNPASWTNFDPKPGEPFRRFSYAGIPDAQEPAPSLYYPK
ncbi:MAG TPA: hypothetical protein VGG97_13555 [Bryobacteraceae bacterium]|jgi:hypothetical protein